MKIFSMLVFCLILLGVSVGEAKVSTINSGGSIKLIGVSKAEVDASTVEGVHFPFNKCVGFIGKGPSHVLKVNGFGAFEIRVKSKDRLVLVVQEVGKENWKDCAPLDPPTSRYMKSEKYEPAVTIGTTGAFNVYVGSKDKKEHPYELLIYDGAG